MPPPSDNYDEKNINEEWRDVEDEDFRANLASLHDVSLQEMFKGYYYDLALVQLSENADLQEKGITEAIMRSINTQEVQS